MVAISIMIEGQQGLNWPRWKRLVAEVEALGFAGLFRSDHFTGPNAPDEDALETVTSLGYLADRSERLHFGTLVAPVSFRDPIILARQALAIDDLSEGRLMFGYALGDIKTRFARFEEALEIVTRLLRDDARVTFDGRFYQLKDATFLPRPARPGGPRIMIGGSGPQRTMPLTARYADWWNGVGLDRAAFRERSGLLDRLLREHGRAPGDVRRTIMRTVHFGADLAAVERRVAGKLRADLADKPFEQALETLIGEERSLIGTPDMLIEQIRADGAAGAEELMLQWFDLDDIEGLRAFATSVLPHVN
jgi:alkanesulfonate monooxygenase SsuD/methylene tetrahydromethanopterin reductase-like flavin-dependent oxidoreductase (luciferase family)